MSLYPLGKPWGIAYGKEDATATDTEEAREATAADQPEKDATPSPARKRTEQDTLDKKLERVRQAYGLTQDQMNQVVQDGKTQAATGSPANNSSPHCRLNAVVYVVILSVLVIVLNHQYDNYVARWFGRWFPREAATLAGMLVPKAS